METAWRSVATSKTAGDLFLGAGHESECAQQTLPQHVPHEQLEPSSQGQ